MKIGYSLLLGEYIEAYAVEYDDCKNFQIVCPSCKEPVFKGVRWHDDKEIHYLSHYAKDISYDEECELRVNSLSKDIINTTNSEARKQRLAYFLQVLKDIILQYEYPEESIPKVKKLFGRLNKSKPISFIRDNVYTYLKKISLTQDDLYTFLESYVQDIIEIQGKFFSTQYSLQTQKRIAYDIWQHLLSTPAKENFDFLFHHGYIVLMGRLEKAMKIREPADWEKYLYQSMIKLMNTSKIKGFQLIDTMRKVPIQSDYAENFDMLSKMGAEITHEMLGCLLRLPYFDLIKKARLHQVINQGITEK